MTASEPTILATCAGIRPGDGWLDARYGILMRYAAVLANVPPEREARIVHVNTAGGDQRMLEGDEVAAGAAVGVRVDHLRLFPHPNVPDVRSFLLSHDVVWVNGGSVSNMLAVWRVHGLDRILREAWESGVVLAGISAGGLCWHTSGTTASFGPGIDVFDDGLGFVPHSFGVHFDSDPHRRPVHEAAIASGRIPWGYAVDEGVGIVYRGLATEVAEVVAESDGHAYRIERAADGVSSTTLTPRRIAEADIPVFGRETV